MKWGFFGVAAFAAVSTAGVTVTISRQEETIRPNVMVGNIAIGGLTKDDAARKLRVWWESRKRDQLTISAEPLGTLPPMTAGELGITLDDVATVAQAPTQTFIAGTSSAITQEQFATLALLPVYKPNGAQPAALLKEIKAATPEVQPATVHFIKGNIVRRPERSQLTLDRDALPGAVEQALRTDGIVKVPLVEAPKKISDDDLTAIKEVVSVFSTRFSARNAPRSSNIRLAASKLDGLVLAPGDKFSFNQMVGQRTLKAGFKLAGVYINGQHDVGVGGGICQVSTTLYNAALFANLPILRRSNHSLPVPYVPLGRDATVNWGAQDLVFENSFDHPIAITANYEPGKLSFRILGTKDPSISVRIEGSGVASLGTSVRTVVDPSLKPGSRKVVQPGEARRTCSTFRLVFQNGKLVRREPLGTSSYGSTTVIAVGPTASPAGAIQAAPRLPSSAGPG